MRRRVHADREGDDIGEDQSRERDDEGQQQALANQTGNRRIIFERPAEIPLKQAEQPVEITFDRRAIHSVLLAQEIYLLHVGAFALGLEFRHHRGQIVAGGKLDDDEHDGADRQQSRHHDEQAAQNVM